VASFTVEDFSVDRLLKIRREDIQMRLDEYRKMLMFWPWDVAGKSLDETVAGHK